MRKTGIERGDRPLPNPRTNSTLESGYLLPSHPVFSPGGVDPTLTLPLPRGGDRRWSYY
ncbi:hypothetical protein J0895_23350 [Phormidium pseudopriestleyi FRX01]|uniref:Uncharacterized protein n=1 Tax=Phormidium pseudopriestleyi FRX01 TaxID=1759528 RepID=A0ABS3FXU4_9CYAN|nr:hypothetical protein [Phormidium pseudopriestleyi]MBO0351965.1 hypothetical protein [Phormidium pseudopriestleyi FRX01]